MPYLIPQIPEEVINGLNVCRKLLEDKVNSALFDYVIEATENERSEEILKRHCIALPS